MDAGSSVPARMRAPSILQLPPIWRESRVWLEAASLLRHDIWRAEEIPHAGGQPVMLLPGFLAGDDSLGLMTKWLRRTGHHTRSGGMRLNVDCSGRVLERVEERLEELKARQGQRVAIVGQSRGGTLARVMAVRRPDLVSGIVTLGSPLDNPFAVHPLVRAQVLAVGLLGTAGIRGLFSNACREGDCCRDFWEQLTADFPANVGFLSIYSKTDGIVRWRACLDPAATHLEVDASHIGMAVNPGAYAGIAEALEGFRKGDLRRPGRRLRSAA